MKIFKIFKKSGMGEKESDDEPDNECMHSLQRAEREKGYIPVELFRFLLR